METKSDDLILAAGNFATELLEAIAREHPEMRADVERATAGGAALVVEVSFGVASVNAALVVRGPNGQSAEVANVTRSIGGGTAH